MSLAEPTAFTALTIFTLPVFHPTAAVCAPLLAQLLLTLFSISTCLAARTILQHRETSGLSQCQGECTQYFMRHNVDHANRAMWIRMTTNDVTNNPKSGMSCNLIHDRYVLMYGGCWMEGNKCLNYGWNPLLYYIIAGDYWMADWNWHYNPNAAGYNVPKQIFDVVGGE